MWKYKKPRSLIKTAMTYILLFILIVLFEKFFPSEPTDFSFSRFGDLFDQALSGKPIEREVAERAKKYNDERIKYEKELDEYMLKKYPDPIIREIEKALLQKENLTPVEIQELEKSRELRIAELMEDKKNKIINESNQVTPLPNPPIQSNPQQIVTDNVLPNQNHQPPINQYNYQRPPNQESSNSKFINIIK